jgi:GTP cyclohydrolase II
LRLRRAAAARDRRHQRAGRRHPALPGAGGSGIGLGNKLRVYCLQDEGLDTIDADRTIGFGDDERDFRIAHDILASIGVTRITLLTNNPAKIAALRSAGTEVANRQPLFGLLTSHNRRYLTAMADRHGHLLHALLDEQEEIRPGVAAGAERGLAC